MGIEAEQVEYVTVGDGRIPALGLGVGELRGDR
jgi:hypothetical protein